MTLASARPSCFPEQVVRGARFPLLVVLAVLVALPGCGDGEDAHAPDDTPSGTSAFRLAVAPETVTHDLDLAFVRNGIGRPDPRDAIPALFDPQFVPAREVPFLPDDARVIVVEVGSDARAYPIDILDRHELVNDHAGGTPILVTWCPLCASSVVFDREVGGEVLTFGVSGFLYRSDVLMYDHQSESFWSQLEGAAVAGPRTGTALRTLPSRVTTLDAFRRKRPGGKVLRSARGMLPAQAYAQRPYAAYLASDATMFPVGPIRDDLPVKAEVLGVSRGGEAVAFPIAALRKRGAEPLRHAVGGATLEVRYDPAADEATVRDEDGNDVVATRLFWFAWQAFHPKTRVHRP